MYAHGKPVSWDSGSDDCRICIDGSFDGQNCLWHLAETFAGQRAPLLFLYCMFDRGDFPGAQFSFSVPTAAFVSAGVLTVFLRGYQGVKFKTQNFYDVTLGFHGKTVCVRALRDTGNQLKDPLTGKPVSILAYDAARGLLDKDAKMFYIPFHSIGKSSGLLPGMTLDYMNIRREKDLQRLERPVIAVSKEPVNRDGKYQLILHPQLLDE